MKRRDLLKASVGVVGITALAAGAWSASRPWRLPIQERDIGWDSGIVTHIIPTASDTKFRLTVSLEESRSAVILDVTGRRYNGIKTDTVGQHWQFDVPNLTPSTTYQLRLFDNSSRPLCEAWPLATLPSPSEATDSCKLLVYTCAGGSDLFWTPVTAGLFQPSEIRSRLLARGLSLEPDAVIANGDHIYWDLDSKYGLVQGRSIGAKVVAGEFDREKPMLGSVNEAVLKQGCGPQVAGIYGTMMRSTPCWFLADDHDYFENDEWKDGQGTFPPDAFHLEAAQAVQRLYYPKPITPDNQPDGTAGLRFGKLVEALLYDCRKNAELSGGDAFLIAPNAEAWLINKMVASDAAHIVNVPSLPILWTAGKWMEWYADSAKTQPKPGWSPAWREQHDRLVAASTSKPDRISLWLNGDLHCSGVGQIEAIGETILPQPALAVLCGTIGTASMGFPSQARGIGAAPANGLTCIELVKPREENGFAIIEFKSNEIEIALFCWKPQDGIDAIDDLEPFWKETFERPD